MTWKRELEYQYHYAKQYVVGAYDVVQLPGWFMSRRMRGGLLTGLAFGVLTYVLTVSAVATRGYAIHDLEKQIAALQDQQQQLAVAIATKQSMASIQDRLAGMPLVPVTAMALKNISTETVVAKK